MENTNYTRSNSYPNGFNDNDSVSGLKKSNSHNDIEKLYKDIELLEKKFETYTEEMDKGQLADESDDEFKRRLGAITNKRSDCHIKLENIYRKLATENGSLENLLNLGEKTGNDLLKVVCYRKIINLIEQRSDDNYFINISKKSKNKDELTFYNKNEDEELLLESCIDGNLEISDDKLYYNEKEIKLKSIRADVVNVIVRKCCTTGNFKIAELLLKNKFRSTTGYENEDEKLLLESCIDGNLEISDDKLYYNGKEIKLKNIRNNIIETAFELCCTADNFELVKLLLKDKSILNIKNLILNNCENIKSDSFFSHSILQICENDCSDTLKIFINDPNILKCILEDKELIVIKDCLNQAGAGDSFKIINLLINNEKILNNTIVCDKKASNGLSCTINTLARDITCFRSGFQKTTEVYLKNDLVRKTMIKEKIESGDSYIINQYRGVLTLGYLNVIKLMLSYNDIMEHIANYDIEILLQTLKEAYKQRDLELIEKLSEYDKDGKQHLIDALKNNKLEIFEILAKNGVKFEENSGKFIHFEKRDKIIFDTIKSNLKKICKKYNIEYNEKDLFHLGNNLNENQSYTINLKEMDEVLDRIRIKIKEDNNREYCKNLMEEILELDNKINSNLNKITYNAINHIFSSEEKKAFEKENRDYEFKKKSLSRLLIKNVNCIDYIYELCFNKLVSIDDKDKLKCLLKVLNIEPKNSKEKVKKEEIEGEISKLQTELFKVPIIDESDIKLLDNCIIGDLNNFKTNYNGIKFNIASLLTKGFELACACGNLNIVEYILENENLKNIIINTNNEYYFCDIFSTVIEKGEMSIFEKLLEDNDIRSRLIKKQQYNKYNHPIYDYVKKLCNMNKEESEKGLKILFEYEDIKELIKSDIDFVKKYTNDFIEDNYSIEIIKLVLKDSMLLGSDLNNNNDNFDNHNLFSIFYKNIRFERLDVVEFILDSSEGLKTYLLHNKLEQNYLKNIISLAYKQNNSELIKKILSYNSIAKDIIIETFKTAFEQDNLELIKYMLLENNETKKIISDENILVRYSEDMFKNGQINNVLEYLISCNNPEIVVDIDKLLECFKVACEKGYLYVVKEFIRNKNIRKILSDKIIDLYNFAFNNNLDNITIEIFNCEKDNIIEKDQNGNVLKKHLSILLSKNQINEFIKLFEEQNIREKIVNDREFFNMVFAKILYTGNIEFLKKIFKNLNPNNTNERQLVVDCFYFFYTRNNDTILFNKILNEDDIKEKFRESNNTDKNTIFYKALIGSDFDLVDKLVRRDINFRNTTGASISVKNESDFENIKSNIKKLFNRYGVSYNKTDVFDERNHSINVTEIGERLVEIKNNIDYCEKLRKEIHISCKIASIPLCEMNLPADEAAAKIMKNNCNIYEKSRLLSKNVKSINDVYQFCTSEEISIGDENKLKCLIKILNIEPLNKDEETKKNEVENKIIPTLQAKLFNTTNEDIIKFLTECIKGNLDEIIAFYDKNKDKNKMIPILIKGFKFACICDNLDMIKGIFENNILKNFIINNNDNYYFLKSLVVKGNYSIIEILVNDDYFRRKLVGAQKENGDGSIYSCINELCVSISEQGEKIMKILLSHTDVVNSFINNKLFKERDFMNYIKFGSIEIIKLIFNDSIIPNMDKDDILMYFKYGFECGRLDFIELLLNCERIKSTEDGNYIVKETLKAAYEEFYEENNPILLKDLMSYNNGEIKNIIVENGIFSDYVKDLFKDGKVYILDYFLSSNSELKETIFKDNILSECLKLACENGRVDIFNYAVYSLIKNQEIENEIFEDNSKTLFECCNLALLNGHAEIAMEMFNDSKIRKNIIKNDNDGKLVSYYALRFYSNGNFNKFKELFKNKEAREKIIKNKGSFDMIMINICDTDNIELLRMIFKNLDKNDYPRAMEEYLQKCSINTFNLLLGDKDISSKIDIDTLYSKLKEVSDNEKIKELLKSDISELFIGRVKDSTNAFISGKPVALQIALIKNDSELFELLVKNGIFFTNSISFNNEEEFNNFKKCFKDIANKYGVDCNIKSVFPTNSVNIIDSVITINNDRLANINDIMNKIREKIENREELFELIINKDNLNSAINDENNNIEQKINKLNDISEKLTNYNINKDSKFTKYYLPEIRDDDNTIFEMGFGGITTFRERLFNSRIIEIAFKKNGFLRKTLENNNIVSDEIMNIFKGSLIIEQGRNWKNFDESRLDAILMFFKTDPVTAFEMLLYLEREEGFIKLEKKGMGRFSLPRRLKDSEKKGILQSFDFVVKLRKQLVDMVEFKNNILKNNELSDDTRNNFKIILDFGINILYKINDMEINDKTNSIISQKIDITNNIDRLFKFVGIEYQKISSHNIENLNEESCINDKTRWNNDKRIMEITKIFNNRENESNEFSPLDDLNSCINIIDNENIGNSCTIQ